MSPGSRASPGPGTSEWDCEWTQVFKEVIKELPTVRKCTLAPTPSTTVGGLISHQVRTEEFQRDSSNSFPVSNFFFF